MIKEKSKTWVAVSHSIGLLFSKLPFSPNFITWTTLPVALFGFISIVMGHTAIGLIFFIATGILDIIDGPLARYLGKPTAYGAFLDGSLDRFVDFLVIFSYLWLAISTPLMPLAMWVAMAIFFAIIPSFEVAYANHRGAVNDPEEKLIWRILNRGEMYTLMMLVIFISQWSMTWAGYFLVLLVLLSAITTLQTMVLSIYLAHKKTITENNNKT